MFLRPIRVDNTLPGLVFYLISWIGYQMAQQDFAWHKKYNLKPLINVSGTMTSLGASIASTPIVNATAEAMSHFVSIHEAQALASTAIEHATGAEAGFLTASASAGISLSIASCMTGVDPSRVEALPIDSGPCNEIVIQAGHLCGYGAPIEQAITLTGAKVKSVGQSTLCMDHQIKGGMTSSTAAGLFVVSHHTVPYGQCPLQRFIQLCHDSGVPVIVDAASEYDLRGFIEAGADIVVYSGHKFLGGPTSGIVAGKRDLIRGAYLQNIGIGRGMKIGKESIFGTIEALGEWEKRDHETIRAQENEILEHWLDAISGFPGVLARVVPDPTGNPLERLQVEIDEATFGANAIAVARSLSELEPAIMVRNHEVELGYFQLDPCNLKPGQVEIVREALQKVLSKPGYLKNSPEDLDIVRNGGVNAYLEWGL